MRCFASVLSLVMAASFAVAQIPPATTQPAKPAAAPPTFNEKLSDPKAVALAEKTLEAMGGREAWEATRYLTWNFFGQRRHVWDKETGDIRVEWSDRASGAKHIVLMNLDTKKGRAFVAGEEIDDPARKQQLLDDAYGAWVNDSYWMFMPYKLRDAGVVLSYKGEAAMGDGRMADVISVVFTDDVGLTPENKYDVYIAKDDSLVGQWSYYPQRTHDAPRFTMPWNNWKRYGRIMLSDQRGENRTHTDVAVFDELPRRVFESPESADEALKPEPRPREDASDAGSESGGEGQGQPL